MTREMALDIVLSKYPLLKNGSVLTENEMVELVLAGYNAKLQLPAELDEAAREWSEVFITEECKEACNYGFRVGAKWMAEQGVTKEAVIGMATEEIAINISQKALDSLGLGAGDKAIVQFRKV